MNQNTSPEATSTDTAPLAAAGKSEKTTKSKKAGASPALKTPGILAFERKISPSDAKFFQRSWAAPQGPRHPVEVVEKTVRGTISNRPGKKEADETAKPDARAENANIQTVDVAMLRHDCDTLETVFTLRVLPMGAPSACGSPKYSEKLMVWLAAYAQEHRYTELANRYARNILAGRTLWRNLHGAEKVACEVHRFVEGRPELLVSVANSFDEAEVSRAAETLGGLVAAALRGDEHLSLLVTTSALVGAGQEVFPSQELQADKSDKKSKVLYTTKGVAAQHSQKIGNAIRTVDDWYPDAKPGAFIAAEPYGAVTTRGEVHRPSSSKMDFYSLLDGLMENDGDIADQHHYLVSVLIRGGVFGKGKDKQDSGAETAE